MRNFSGETRNRAATINIIPPLRGKIPLNIADQRVGPYSTRLGHRCFELPFPLARGFADHFRNECFLGREVVIEAPLRKPGFLHQLYEADRVDALFTKKPLGRFEDAFPVVYCLLLANSHWPAPPTRA